MILGGYMNNKIKKIILSIIIFLTYSFFSYFIEIIINILNIDISTWKYIHKLMFIYGLDLLPLLLLIFIYFNELKDNFKDFKINFKEYANKYAKFWLLGLIIMSLTNSIISVITSNPIGNNEEAVRKIIDVLPMYSIFSTCIVAPLVEELIYRKTLLNIFNKKWLAIIASGLIFGLAHVLGTYKQLSDLLYIIPYGSLGAIFMYILYDSKNIWNTITLHFIHNTILISIYIISRLL